MPAPTPLAVIIPAAGRSTRFGPNNKLTQPLHGKPVLLWTLQAFLRRLNHVQLIVIPTDTHLASWFQSNPQIQEQLQHYPPQLIRLCPGGPSRAHSVGNALRLIPPNTQWIAIHDAARPLLSQQLIDRTLAAAIQFAAAVPALPVLDTIKQAPPPSPAKVLRTLPRHDLWAIQTPQIFRTLALKNAFDSCPLPLEQISDDAQFLELAGHDVYLVQGEQRNIKITTPLDLRLAQLLLSMPT